VEGKAWETQGRCCEKSVPQERGAALGQHTGVEGVLHPWEASRVGQRNPSCLTDTATDQLSGSTKMEPVEQQENAVPVQKDTAVLVARS